MDDAAAPGRRRGRRGLRQPSATGGRFVSILVDRDSRVLVQGITGREGSFHTGQMVEYGTNVVAGVTPGGEGKTVSGVPVFNTVADAVAATRPNVSIIFVPARFAPDAIYEAVDNGIPFVVCITEGIPVADMVPVYAHVQRQRFPPAGPKLPGADHTRPGQDRHHAGLHPYARSSRRRLPLRNAHLRGRRRAHARRHRPEHRGRHRRRPGDRHVFCRRVGNVRG